MSEESDLKNNNDAAYKSLLDRLELYTDWPSLYRFKFIFKADAQTALTIESWFAADVEKRYIQSSAKNYQSLTIDVLLEKPEEVIEIYKKGAKIDGLVML